MRELVVISGKGGTGKTSIVASIAALAKNKVMVDCDVDAADLHIILKPKIDISKEFYCGKGAQINLNLCKKCSRCIEVCKFEAITKEFVVNEIKCEGCGSCYYQCPSNAIEFTSKKSGDWFESTTRFGKLIHARLGIAEENSGKLVSEIKNHARLLSKENDFDLIIIDGPPGIGCPVIATISGAHLVLIVTEPTLSGIHDAKRVLELTKHFKISTCVCINKYDLNTELTTQIEMFCAKYQIDIVAKIPYSNEFTQAQIKGLSLVEYSNSEISKQIITMWNKINSKLMEKENVK